MVLARTFRLAALVALALCARATAQVVPVAREAVAVRGQPTLIEVRVGVDATVPPVVMSDLAPRVRPGRM